MIRSMNVLAITATAVCVSSIDAAETITFDTTVQGFVAAEGTATHSTVGGGSVRITDGDDWNNNSAEFQIQSNNAFRAEFEQAVAVGGTLSFDITIVASDYAPTDNPTYFEIVLNPNTQADGFGANVLVAPGFDFSSLQADGSQTRTVSVDMSMFGSDYAGLSSSGWGNVHIGSNTQNDAFAGGVVTYYVDNLTISAVPEPASLALLGLGAFVAAGRRRSR